MSSAAADNDNETPKCAACGKGDDGLKTCTACKLVKYCNATCQKAHRSRHKKECKKRAAELHDEALFKKPSRDECPICMLPLPLNYLEHNYQTCCGKVICKGCLHADAIENKRKICPFCRTPTATSAVDQLERIKKRVEDGDAVAMSQLGVRYADGDGLSRDEGKAVELWLRAGELGFAASYGNVGSAYYNGQGVEKDTTKAKHYYELAAMGGQDADSRYYVGIEEVRAGNMDRAVKHWMISAGDGHDESLKAIREEFMRGNATKDDFEKALRAHKAATDEMKSDQREAAAALEHLFLHGLQI